MKFTVSKASKFSNTLETVEITTLEELKAVRDRYDPKEDVLVSFPDIYHPIGEIVIYDALMES
jgi:hypothetical protein